jgi:hypothetical protein
MSGEPAGYELGEEPHALRLPCLALRQKPERPIRVQVGARHPHQQRVGIRTFSLAGDELSMQQIADAFSRVTARDVKYVQVSWVQFEKNMGPELTVMYHWFEEKRFHFNIEQVRREYPLTHTFNRWLEAYWNTTAVAAH